MADRIQPRQLTSGVLESPVGRVTISSYLRDSGGVSFSRPRIFGSYAIVYMLDGAGRYVDARGERPVRPGDLIIVFPDIAHAYGPTAGSHWDELHIVFDGPLFDLWRSHDLLLPSQPILHLEPIEYWRPRMEAVIVDPAGQGNPPALTVIGRLVSFLAEAIDASHRERMAGRDRQWLESARSMLDPQLAGRETPLEVVAEEMGVSYVAFRKRFTQLMGMPPGHYRVRRVIDKACLLMHANPAMGNKEVARHCGFANEYHFSRRFKQVVGLSPKQFRSQIAMPA